MPKTPSQVASGTRWRFSSWEPESPLDATSGSGQDAPADQQEGDGKRGRQRSPGDEARPKRQHKTKKQKNKQQKNQQLDLLEPEDDPLIQLRLLKDRLKLKKGVAPARLKFLNTLLNESRDLSEGNESKGNLLKRLVQKMELEMDMDLSRMKELETNPTSGASRSREEASAAASDGQGDHKERGDLQAVEAYGSLPGKEKVDLQAAKDSSPTAGKKGKGKRIGYEAQQKESNIEDVKTSSQQETRKLKRKKQKKRQRRKMEESTENLSCRSGSPSSSHDGTSTSTIEGEPEPSFGDLASIAQDHDDKIASDVVDIKQEQESAGDIQALLDMDEDAIQEKFDYYLKQLGRRPTEYDYWPGSYEPEQLTEFHERLAIYRIVGYELSKGRKLGKQDIAKLKEQYDPSILRKERYFRHYEKSLEWYFNIEWCEYSGFHDYQRLALHDNLEFLDWEQYHLTSNTYEDDLAYVRYCARLADETKWIEDYLGRDITQAEWRRVNDIASVQALKVARESGGVYARAALAGLKDHMWSIRFDFNHYKDFDGVYFEIWKRVAKRKMNFKEALSEVYREDMFPVRKNGIKYELDDTRRKFRSMKEKYDAHVACIDESVPEDEVRQLIKEAVIKMNPKPQTYLDYARRKLQISMNIDLITKERRRETLMAEVADQC